MTAVLFHPAAERDVSETVDWYEAASPGLGGAFLDELERALALVAESPGAWPTWPSWPGADPMRQVRRFRLSRFPHAIAYRASGTAVLVIAVAHPSRAPRYWHDRVG